MATPPTGNGVFVVTQYIPAANSNTGQQGPSTSKTPCFLRAFIRGQPKALGVVQIMVAVVNVFLGGVLCSTKFLGVTAYSGVPFWGALFFFISGGLSISAENKATRGLVKGSLVMNIFSAMMAGVAIILYSCDLARLKNTGYDDKYDCESRKHNKKDNACLTYREALFSYQDGILVLLLLLMILELCVSMATSGFGCKSVCCCSQREAAQPLFVGQNDYTQDPRVLPTQATGMPIAHGMPLMQEMPPSYEISSVVPRISPAQGVTSDLPTAPPPSYYQAVPGDFKP